MSTPKEGINMQTFKGTTPLPGFGGVGQPGEEEGGFGAPPPANIPNSEPIGIRIKRSPVNESTLELTQENLNKIPIKKMEVKPISKRKNVEPIEPIEPIEETRTVNTRRLIPNKSLTEPMEEPMKAKELDQKENTISEPQEPIGLKSKKKRKDVVFNEDVALKSNERIAMDVDTVEESSLTDAPASAPIVTGGAQQSVDPLTSFLLNMMFIALFYYVATKIFTFYGVGTEVYGLYFTFYLFLYLTTMILPTEYKKIK
jgi:hypothetical protein